MIEQLIAAWLAGNLPMDRDRFFGAQGGLMIRRRDSNEVAITHNNNSPHRFRGFCVG